MSTTVRKVPMRQCTGCQEMKNKKEMIRVLDATGKKNGRGAYLCRSMHCLEKAVKNKGLERSLKVKIPSEVYDALREELKCL